MASLADLAAQAAKAPYELDLPDGTKVSIPQPTLGRWLDAPVTGKVSAFLEALGVSEEDAKRADEALRDAPLGTSDRLFASLRNYFGLGN